PVARRLNFDNRMRRLLTHEYLSLWLGSAFTAFRIQIGEEVTDDATVGGQWRDERGFANPGVFKEIQLRVGRPAFAGAQVGLAEHSGGRNLTLTDLLNARSIGSIFRERFTVLVVVIAGDRASSGMAIKPSDRKLDGLIVRTSLQELNEFESRPSGIARTAA